MAPGPTSDTGCGDSSSDGADSAQPEMMAGRNGACFHG
jgi:hypothetical protein